MDLMESLTVLIGELIVIVPVVAGGIVYKLTRKD